MLRVSVLATSSAGNCTFAGTEKTRILIDAGLSRKDTFERIAALGEDPDKLDAVIVTHEHSDHVSGLGVLSRYFRKKHNRELPIYMTRLTAPLIEWIGDPPPIEAFQAGTGFTIGDLEIQSFTIPHDAQDPVGFTVKSGGIKFGLAMDLGYMPESVKFHLRGCHTMVLESNHDLEMLKVGPYPWSVKQRVMGRKGHLSNDMVGDYIANDVDSELQTLLLGHLSEHNNHPEIVRMTAEQALQRRGTLFGSTRLIVAEPGKQSEVFRLG